MNRIPCKKSRVALHKSPRAISLAVRAPPRQSTENKIDLSTRPAQFSPQHVLSSHVRG